MSIIKKIKISKKTLFTQYLSLYLITALLPVMVLLPALTISYQALKSETLHANSASVRTIQKSLDTKFLELDKVLLTIGTDAALTSYTLQNKPLEAISRLDEIVSQQDFIKDILIIETDSDYIYSSYGRYLKSANTGMIRSLEKNGYSYEEWNAQLETKTAVYWPILTYDMTALDTLYLISPIYSHHESLSERTEATPQLPVPQSCRLTEKSYRICFMHPRQRWTKISCC